MCSLVCTAMAFVVVLNVWVRNSIPIRGLFEGFSRVQVATQDAQALRQEEEFSSSENEQDRGNL